MAASLSDDQGFSWKYYASPFEGIHGGQRAVLMRLEDESLLFIGFANNGFIVEDRCGDSRNVTGLFASVSTDEGKTWQSRLVSDDGPGRTLEVRTCSVHVSCVVVGLFARVSFNFFNFFLCLCGDTCTLNQTPPLKQDSGRHSLRHVVQDSGTQGLHVCEAKLPRRNPSRHQQQTTLRLQHGLAPRKARLRSFCSCCLGLEVSDCPFVPVLDCQRTAQLGDNSS